MVQYEEWDEALPHVTFGLITHVSTATNMSLFEFVRGFPARAALTMDLSDSSPSAHHKLVVTLAQQIANCHNAASDHIALAQDYLGHLLKSAPFHLL